MGKKHHKKKRGKKHHKKKRGKKHHKKNGHKKKHHKKRGGKKRGKKHHKKKRGKKHFTKKAIMAIGNKKSTANFLQLRSRKSSHRAQFKKYRKSFQRDRFQFKSWLER